MQNRLYLAAVACLSRLYYPAAAVQCGALLVLYALSSPAVAQQPEAFCLTAHIPPLTPEADGEHRLTPDLLSREIVRQSVLIIARDEFGLPTRDSVLREPVPSASDSSDLFDIEIEHCQNTFVSFRLLRGGELVHEGTVAFSSGGRDTVWSLAEAMEQESRTRFVASLRKAGLEHRPLEPKLGEGGTTEGMLNALSRMDLVSQYAAMRLAHQAMREHGETRDLLGILVRGYANLSQLTAFHADSARYAFAARAVMYATRLISLEPNSPNGYWHRAYASGVFGMTQSALWDLANAGEQCEVMDDAPAAPAWVELVDLACRYRYIELEQHINANAGDLRQLATLLWYRAAEFAGNHRITLETGEDAWREMPHCLRLPNGMMRLAGVRWGHRLSTHPFEVADLTVPIALRRAAADAGGAGGTLARLSAEAQRADTLLGRSRLCDELMQDAGLAVDTAEPSLAVLGALLDEMDFVLIAERAGFLRDDLAVSCERYLDSVAQSVEGHPHERLLQTLRLVPGRDPDRFAEYLADYEPAEGSVFTTQVPMLQRSPRDLRMADGTSVRDWLDTRYYFTAPTDIEDMTRLWGYDDPTRLERAREMATIHPYSPQRLAILIELDWDNVKDNAEAWEQEYGRYPAVAYVLAVRYERLGRIDDALRLYTLYKDAAPDKSVYYRLATMTWCEGDHDRAEAYVREFLEQEDYGLQHANLAKDLALSYMAEGDYDSAEPWILRSASSGAGWARINLAIYYEHTGNYDQARRLLRDADAQFNGIYSAAQRIRIDNDVAGAREDYERYVLQHFGPDTYKYKTIPSIYALIEGDYDTAIERWTELFLNEDFPFQSCLIGALAIANGDEDTFLLMYQDAAGRDPEQYDLSQQNYIHFARAMLDAHEAGKVPDELGDQINPDIYDSGNHNLNFFIACWHEHTGDTEHAAVFYRKCAGFHNRGHRTTLRAFVRLRELGEDPFAVPTYWPGFQRYDIRFADVEIEEAE